ncbi:threonine synthase [Aliikangiella marina]|uniref:Threonine synthase n=1 Tax=Aliikangiella marina TaxID=1712262 RepID=A0A545T6V9_9GAMM|nr:threonine synthase [Aliikangiella marina]TQV72964.1 threonine synthase [Aliikangiella marina]
MELYNLKDDSQIVNFETAVRTGLGNKQGLFFPQKFSPIEDQATLLNLETKERNKVILSKIIGKDLSSSTLEKIIDATFRFPAKLAQVTNNEYCLELFHGPTLAFKDFGANFMANCLQSFSNDQPITILTATSGDTGAAVAHAFHRLPNIRVVILFPHGKISELQQKMFTTLGDNIHTVAIEGDFDACQALVKQSFDDLAFVKNVGLNSANSINISRLLAQVCYYFDAFVQLPEEQRKKVVVCVPSGNFGNLCAGIIAKTLGLPIKRFIAATNLNDTVPRFLASGEWTPKQTIATISNAMDVSNPNNWPRIQYLIDSGQFDSRNLTGCAVDERQTEKSMHLLQAADYLSEPHAAVAYHGLHQSLKPDETGIFLGTAHPAKFKSTVDQVLDIDIKLPEPLAKCAQLTDLSVKMPADFERLKDYILEACEES